MYVIITGASRGIGKELAKVYVSHKYSLILTCRNNIDDLLLLKNSIIDEYNVNMIIHKGNINEYLISDIDDIYILINNASITNYKMLIDVDEKDFYDVIDNNIKNTVFNSKYVIKKMLKNKQGIICNISSVWGIVGASLESLYSLSKGAINSFTQSISKEYESQNIKCFAIALGMVDTDMNNHLTNEELGCIKNRLINNKLFSSNEIARYIYDTIQYNRFKNGEILIKDNGLLNC